MAAKDTLGFELEWFDPVSSVVNKIYMKYYLDNDTIELLHSKMKSAFLARIHYPEVTLNDLFVGNSITIFNRLLVVKGYANIATERFMAAREVHFLIGIEGAAKQLVGDVMEVGSKFGLFMNRMKTTASVVMTKDLNAHVGDIIMEFVATSGCDSESFLTQARAINAGVTAMVAQVRDINDIFETVTNYYKKTEFCTLCLIKPHVLKSKAPGPVLKEINASGFNVDAMFSVHLNSNMAEYLLDVYRGIYPEYTSMISEINSGPLLAVMITGENENIVKDFREFCGPLEPELAKKLRPKSLRALFGTDVVRNAIHCTDLPEDGETECTYLFDTIANV